MYMARIMKRKSAMSARKKYVRKTRTRPKKRFADTAEIKSVVNTMVARKLETKPSVRALGESLQISHNNFQIIENGNTFFRTENGTGDPMTGTGGRIGDEITLKGISFNMMIELDIRYSDVTFRIIVIKSAKGDTPTRSSLFRGLSDNKMLDKFNTERYTIVAQKFVQLKTPNAGTTGAMGTRILPLPIVPSTGFNANVDANSMISRATKIVKMYVPGTKFGRNGTLKYEDLSTTHLKFFDYPPF